MRRQAFQTEWECPPGPECAMPLNIMTSCEIVHAIVAMVTTFPQKAAKK